MDECDGLENRYTLTGIKGSNPFPSARIRHEINGFGVLVGVPSSAKEWVLPPFIPPFVFYVVRIFLLFDTPSGVKPVDGRHPYLYIVRSLGR